jgi:hypothetical protein
MANGTLAKATDLNGLNLQGQMSDGKLYSLQFKTMGYRCFFFNHHNST